MSAAAMTSSVTARGRTQRPGRDEPLFHAAEGVSRMFKGTVKWFNDTRGYGSLKASVVAQRLSPRAMTFSSTSQPS